ncbi:MAG: IS3 family transposase [Eubacteriales bacterium]|nr:IS3 family transposase [Eubacteriales bacterium]
MAKHYPENQKKMIVSQYVGGRSSRDICKEYGIARSTLFLWKKQYTTDETGQIPRKRYLLEKELERLRTENAIFRACGCSPSSPLSARLFAICEHADEFSIHALCRVLDVNRSTYYHYVFRSPDQTQLQIQDSILKPLIEEIFAKSCGRFGARKIRIKLMEQGHTVSERRILRLMKECGLSSSSSKPRLNSANDRQYQYYPNKLKRYFLTDAPNKIWVSDITYAKVGMDFLYLCVVIDLYSRKVVSYSVSEYIDTALIKEAFLDAFHIRGNPPSLVFHSDQGTQYTSFEFCNLLKKLGVTQSFSAPGSPHDNAVAESFFASIKKEDFRRNYYKTEGEFRIAVKEYIEFYNDYRPHQRLGFLTPNQVEKKFYNAATE